MRAPDTPNQTLWTSKGKRQLIARGASPHVTHTLQRLQKPTRQPTCMQVMHLFLIQKNITERQPTSLCYCKTLWKSLVYPQNINCKYVGQKVGTSTVTFHFALPWCHQSVVFFLLGKNRKGENTWKSLIHWAERPIRKPSLTDSFLRFHMLNWPIRANYCQQSWTLQKLLVIDGHET